MQQPRQSQPLSALAEEDPQHRLAAATRREFGEWGGVNASVEQSVTFTVMSADVLPKIFGGELGPDNGGCYLYSRNFAPTVLNLSRKIAALEGTEAAYCTASGMSAISAAILGLCSSGDRIVASRAIYGGTHALLKDFFPQKCNIQTTFVDITDLQAVAHAFQTTKSTPKVLYTESLANPTLACADIPALAEIAHAHGANLVVDNTFTPMILSPARIGADVVVHSLTKFVSGAADVLAGAVAGSSTFIRSLMDLHNGSLMLLGPSMDPRVAADLSLRLPHLPLRIREHSTRALAMAQRLQSLGAKIIYPGLSSHPQHALMTRLINPGGQPWGYGGIFAVDLGSLQKAKAFMEHLQNISGFGFMAVSLGYFDTLMSASAASTSSEMTSEELQKAGIGPGLVRFSVGLTGTLEQRLAQLEEAWFSINSVEYQEDMVVDAATAAAAVAAVEGRKNKAAGDGSSNASEETAEADAAEQQRPTEDMVVAVSAARLVDEMNTLQPPLKMRRKVAIRDNTPTSPS